MKILNLRQFDGTDRPPRQIQKDSLKWLQYNWAHKHFALEAPVGSGKKAIARTLQRQYRTAYLTANNVLLSEFSEEYPDVNVLIGKQHYTCNRGNETPCQMMSRRRRSCRDCPYLNAVERAKRESTCYNPMSYYYMTKRKNWVPPEVLVIDEAHTFISAIQNIASIKLRKDKYTYPTTNDPLELLEWLDLTIDRLERVSADERLGRPYFNRYNKLLKLRNIFAENQEAYTWFEDFDQDDNLCLYVAPIKIPQEVLDTFLNAKKVIIMSGTLTSFHINEIFGKREYKRLTLKNPVPKENRMIHYIPSPIPINRDTDLEVLAKWLKSILKPYKKESILIHVTYSWAKELKKYFPKALVNTPKNKERILQKFKKEGGVWLAAGCAEGIDLPDDLCRVNVTLRLPRLNRMADLVKKRCLLPGGEKWYDLETLLTFQQQMGRSVRWHRDYSTNIVTDPLFKRLVKDHEDELSPDFLESILWTQNNRQEY